jgi:hypothetical protein
MQGKRKDQTDYSNRITIVLMALAVITVIAFAIFSKI